MPGIIVGVDGSAHSRKALEYAAKEAVAHHTGLTVLTVHQAVRDVYGGVSHYAGDESQTEKARQAAQAETDEVLAAIGGQPESVTVKAVHGLPADELIQAAEGADMVVMGSRGAGGFARLLLGSTATQVAYHANCAVLIAPAAS